jgi:hypothetical protein
MTPGLHLRPALFLAIALVALCGCSDATPPDQSGTYYGSTVAMAGGSGRTYVTTDGTGVPTELGVPLTESAIVGLPDAPTEYVFALPAQASATAFKHAVINWMPMGHAPAMVYTVPHFDMHFYTITNAERVAIVLGDPVLDAKMIRQPTAEFVPAGCASGMASPGMGLHWNDPTAPERNGEPCTKTFIYGSYDGALTFAEPMVAKSYLDTKPSAVVTPLKLPAHYSTHGYHPTSYSVAWDGTAKEYRVALTGFVSR